MVGSTDSRCATRDKLVVLSLVGRPGAKDWVNIKNILAKNGQLLSQSLVASTPDECRDICKDILHGCAADICTSSENDALYDALYRLKTQRLFEIQQSLKLIAEEIGTTTSEAEHIKTSSMDHTETIREAKFSRDSEVARAASGATAEGGSAVSKRDSEMVSTYETHKDEGSIPLVNQNSVSDITHARFGMAEARPETPSSDLRPSRPEAQDTGTETTTMKPSNVFSSPNPVVKWASDERKHPERTEAGQTGDAKHEISQAAGGDAVVVESKDQDNADPGSNSHAGQAVAAGLVEATTPTTAGSMEQAHEFAIGSSKSAASMAEEQQLRNWKKNIGMVWREISGHRFGSMFLSAIKSADAPHYYEVIRQPLDLKTIKNRIRDEDITTTVEFYRDIMHMLMNALMYNSEDTEVYQMAMEILPDAQACVEQLLQTEAVVIQPKDGAGSSGATEVAITANTVAVSNEEDARNDDHDGEDSDASAPAKRRRRVASERASKHLRA